MSGFDKRNNGYRLPHNHNAAHTEKVLVHTTGPNPRCGDCAYARVDFDSLVCSLKKKEIKPYNKCNHFYRKDSN